MDQKHGTVFKTETNILRRIENKQEIKTTWRKYAPGSYVDTRHNTVNKSRYLLVEAVLLGYFMQINNDIIGSATGPRHQKTTIIQGKKIFFLAIMFQIQLRFEARNVYFCIKYGAL